MIAKSVRGALFQWFFFTFILALLQVWVLLSFRWFREEPVDLWQLMLDGGLIFYANSVAMEALARRWGEFRTLVTKRDFDFDKDGMFIYGLSLPILVLLISVVMYCALLSKAPPSNRVVWGELGLIVVALLSSSVHVLRINKLFKDAGSMNLPSISPES